MRSGSTSGTKKSRTIAGSTSTSGRINPSFLNPSYNACASSSSACLSRFLNGSGKPLGRRLHAPKSRTPIRPSASKRKLPGCGSACNKPARSGQVKWKRAKRMPALLRCSWVPSAIILESGIPSNHSETKTLSEDITTFGIATSGSFSYARQQASCASASYL
ncbi:unannotated protein [freshwater metagenome]|uniref:Unannotated protein n=1 Tax=freshwater metagenome TaxID=449393 RepID=A0A6J7N1Z0_9ZZZZ